MPQLRRIDRAPLQGRERAWLDTILWLGDRMTEASTFDYGAIGGFNYPVPYVLSQLSGAYQSVPDFLDSQHEIETREDALDYVARLEEFAREINFEVDRARADAGHAVIPPSFILDKALTQTRNLRAEHGEESGIVRSLVRRTREKDIAGNWGAQAAALVDGPIASALDRQIQILTAMQHDAGRSPSVSRLSRTASASTISACATIPAPA
jgi:uncharacterized protein (DUF885 family)